MDCKHISILSFLKLELASINHAIKHLWERTLIGNIDLDVVVVME